MLETFHISAAHLLLLVNMWTVMPSYFRVVLFLFFFKRL